MCGVFGYFASNSSPTKLIDAFSVMNQRLAPRGRDASGISLVPGDAEQSPPTLRINNGELDPREINNLIRSEGIQPRGFLSHHRLSILDLNERAHQPMASKDGETVISYNGEIYNFKELRKRLTALGYLFRTTSDTEVFLTAYREWGTDCFEQFNGAFTALIYDGYHRRIVGARDRTGIKPLFYLRSNDGIAFSSEIKGFLELDSFPGKVNQATLFEYLVARFPTRQTLRETFFEGVRVVPPGHYFEYDLSSGDFHCTPYWTLTETSSDSTQTENSKKFRSLLQDAVEKRMTSDVKRGCFLSGGLDSSSILYFMNSQDPNTEAISSVFPGQPFNEESDINLVTEQLDVSTHKIQHDFSNFLEDIRELTYIQEQPFPTLNVYSQFLNFRHAQELGFKVVLDGGGADELLAGYSDYALLAQADRKKHQGLKNIENKVLQRFLELSNREYQEMKNKLEQDRRTCDYLREEFRQEAKPDGRGVDQSLDPHFKNTFKNSYLKNGLSHSLQDAWMNKSVRWDNRYLDLSGMSFQVEARVPFQDHRLIEHVLSLSPEDIHNGQETKLPLRKALTDRLPERIVREKSKTGFRFPFCDSLRKDSTFRNFFEEIIHDLAFKQSSVFDHREVRKEFDQIVYEQSNNYNLWRVFNIFLWKKKFNLKV